MESQTQLQHVATQVAVKITAEEKATLQHSDIMERLPCGKGAAQVDEGTKHVRLVSLGHNCGPKLSFQHIGRGAETLPFDWCRVRIEGILHFLQNDFKGFFDYVTTQPVPGIDNMVMYRNYYHSFWHDNPDDEGMQERYTRRIARFKGIDARSRPVLFVRAAMSKDELWGAQELLKDFQERFGVGAVLLLVMPTQSQVQGPALIKGIDHLMVYCLEAGAMTEHGYAAYAKPVREALEWIVGRSIGVRIFDDLETLARVVDEVHNGFAGLGGLDAFEAAPISDLSTLKRNPDPKPQPSTTASSSSSAPAPAAAGTGKGNSQQASARVFSLGNTCAPKLALLHLGLCRPGSDDYPFDWMFLRMKGLMEFLRSDFVGLLEGTTACDCGDKDGAEDEQKSAAKKKTLYRGRWHSFWCEDPKDPAVKAKYEQRIQRFRALRPAAGATKNGPGSLFVRVATCRKEIEEAAGLLNLLREQFGDGACVLLILEGQTLVEGAAVVEGEDNLLVYFYSRSVLAPAPNGDKAPACCKPIQLALDWMQGLPFEAMTVPGLHGAMALATETPKIVVEGEPAFEEEEEAKEETSTELP